jgi:hypothetical protein
MPNPAVGLLKERGITYADAFPTIQKVLREAALPCFVSPSQKVAVVLARTSDGRFTPSHREGAECVLVPLLLRLNAIQWPSSVVQVALRTDLDSIAAGVRITYDARIPLLVDGRRLEDITKAPLHEEPPSDPARLVLGVWRSSVARFRPATGEQTSSASIHVIDETELAFPREIWSGPLAITVRAKRGRTVLANGRLEVRNDKLATCRGLRACDQLSTPEARGLVAAALAQCRKLQSEATTEKVEPLTGSLRVTAGTTSCTVSLTRRCIPNFPWLPDGYRPGLRFLFERLASPTAPVLYENVTDRERCANAVPPFSYEL